MNISVTTSFGRAAAEYDSHARVQADLGAWLAEWLPAERSGRVLELGAGTGAFTRRLVPWNGAVVATDAAPAMCAAGREAVSGAEWHVATADRPPAGPWDLIVSSGMLQWLESPAETFAGWRRELAPGGRIQGALFADGSLAELERVVGARGPVRWRSPEDWRARLEEAGLRVRRETAKTWEYEYASALDLWRSLHRIGAAPERRLGPGALRRMLREYQRRQGRDGAVRATWVFFRFEAEAGDC